MRFLCLHGMRTNSQVLEIQMAAVRFQLGDRHTYEYAEGTVKAPLASELENLFSASDDYYDYFAADDVISGLKAMEDLERFIEYEGPYDGVIAFSQGAAVASTLMIHYAKHRPLDPPPFRCAIFFSGGQPFDPELLKSSKIRGMSYEEDGEVIQVPTAHIWGVHDEMTWVGKLNGLCAAEKRTTYIHDGGHEIPGSRMKQAVTASVNAMRRAIEMADK